MNKRQKKVLGIIIGILFLASCCMECYRVSGGLAIGSFGLMALLLGWLNFDAVGLVWLANPLFLLSLILFLFSKKIKLALFLSAIACYLSLYFITVNYNHYGKEKNSFKKRYHYLLHGLCVRT